MIKIISFYLPQFHEIPEWTNVKKAYPLFFGHNQPRKPLHENYYNLLDDGVMDWQVKLAKKLESMGFVSIIIGLGVGWFWRNR